MVDAGLSLHTNFISPPTNNRAIIEFIDGGVAKGASSSIRGNLILRYVHRIHTVIEDPSELNGLGICLQIADNPDGFISGHAVEFGLARPANRSD